MHSGVYNPGAELKQAGRLTLSFTFKELLKAFHVLQLELRQVD